MTRKEKKLGGLKLLPRDPRNLKLGAIIKLPPLSELPKEFILEPLEVKHQGDSDMCSSFASCLLSELQEGVLLEPSWTFAASKEISGDPDEWGQSLAMILKAHREVGALKKADSPYSLENKDSQFLRHFENWASELKALAYLQRKKSYFEVSGDTDSFDNIKRSIWAFRKEKKGVLFGVQFSWSLSQVVMDTGDDSGFGHALAVLGFCKRDGKDFLVIQNSYGKEAGENGRHYFSREVVNRFVNRYGAFMMTDIPREDAEHMIATGTLISDNWIVALTKSFIHFFRDVALRIFNKTEYDKTGGKPRSPRWGAFVKEMRKEKNGGRCVITGDTDTDLHHKKPFHLFQDMELSPENVVFLRRDLHLIIGHLSKWSSYNSDIDKDIEIWKEKIKNRP